MLGFVSELGRLTLDFGRQLQGVYSLGLSTLGALGQVSPKEVGRQSFGLLNRSMPLVLVVMGFMGAILVIQSCTQAMRILGDLSIIGPGFLQLAVREFGPTIVALMIAARYGAGVGAELGAMTITEQVDALRMAGATPQGYLVAPRVLAGIIGMLPAVIFGTATAFCVGGLVGHYAYGIGWNTYFRLSLVGPGDVLVGATKAVAFGAAVPLISSFAGLSARGGAPGVGRATTLAVIGSSLGVLALDFLVGLAGYLGGA